jgi:hypothetical protein
MHAEGLGAGYQGFCGTQVVSECWPVLGALFFSGTFFVLAFPFFTYVPSGGRGGFAQELAKARPLAPSLTFMMISFSAFSAPITSSHACKINGPLPALQHILCNHLHMAQRSACCHE